MSENEYAICPKCGSRVKITPCPVLMIVEPIIICDNCGWDLVCECYDRRIDHEQV